MSLEENIKSFKELIAGDLDDIPEEAFYFQAGADSVKQRAEVRELVRFVLSAVPGALNVFLFRHLKKLHILQTSFRDAHKLSALLREPAFALT